MDDGCARLGHNQFGRIAGGQEAGFKEYCGQHQATANVKRGDLIVSEDIGYTDASGYFYVSGRVQDCIRVGRRMVFLSKIEAAIRERFSGIECCIGARDLGNDNVELVAVVAAGPVCDSASINAALPEWEHVQRVHILESLPRVPSGKVDRIAVQRIVDTTA